LPFPDGTAGESFAEESNVSSGVVAPPTTPISPNCGAAGEISSGENSATGNNVTPPVVPANPGLPSDGEAGELVAEENSAQTGAVTPPVVPVNPGLPSDEAAGKLVAEENGLPSGTVTPPVVTGSPVLPSDGAAGELVAEENSAPTGTETSPVVTDSSELPPSDVYIPSETEQFSRFSVFVHSAGRHVIGMPSYRASDGFHAVLLQINGRHSREAVDNLRKAIGVADRVPLSSEHTLAVADHFGRAVITIGRSGERIESYEIAVPDGGGVLSISDTSAIDLSGKFTQWIRSHVAGDSWHGGKSSDDVSALLGKIVAYLPSDLDIDNATVLKVLSELIKNPEVVALVKRNGRFAAARSIRHVPVREANPA
jgi:hypothetical protein